MLHQKGLGLPMLAWSYLIPMQHLKLRLLSEVTAFAQCRGHMSTYLTHIVMAYPESLEWLIALAHEQRRHGGRSADGCVDDIFLAFCQQVLTVMMVNR